MCASALRLGLGVSEEDKHTKVGDTKIESLNPEHYRRYGWTQQRQNPIPPLSKVMSSPRRKTSNRVFNNENSDSGR